MESYRMIETKLSVPADKFFLEMILNYVHKLSEAAQLKKKEILHFELAAEEAFMNILEHAYPDGISGHVCVKGIINESELIISFQDKGLPFDQSPKNFSISPQQKQIPVKGLGFRLISAAVDEARFENLGRQGKVLHLIKRLREPLQPDMDMMGEKMESAPLQDYIIRPMREEEAIQVARLFWLAYGYSYKNENFYRPEGLIHLIGSGKVNSLVAVGEDGEVAGHVGLLHDINHNIAEKAFLVVSPAHRGQKLMNKLDEAIETQAETMGLNGLAVDPVTIHPYSQREVMKGGSAPCSMDLATCPHHQFKGISDPEKSIQRESYLHCFRYLKEPPEIVIHVPFYHQDIICRIYEGLHQPYRLGTPTPSPLTGEYHVNFDKNLLKGTIKVIKACSHQMPEILRATDDLANFAQAEVINLNIPLAQPTAIQLCQLAEQSGFFFSGIRPCEAPDGDMLHMQKLYVPFDWDQLKIYPSFAQELCDYVKDQYDRVRDLNKSANNYGK